MLGQPAMLLGDVVFLVDQTEQQTLFKPAPLLTLGSPELCVCVCVYEGAGGAQGIRESVEFWCVCIRGSLGF